MKKLYAALMTAFDENGNIDEQGTREWCVTILMSINLMGYM